MRTMHPGLAVAAVLALAAVMPGQARGLKVARPYYGPGQIARSTAQAQVVVVGKVVAVDSDFTQARPYPYGGAADQKVGWSTATIKVAEDILGAKGKTHLRVGWVPNQSYGYSPYAPGLGGRAWRGGGIMMDEMGYGGGAGPMNLSEGQDVCLLLTMHPDGDFYVPSQNAAPLVKGQGNYDADLKTVLKVVSVVKDPAAALAAKEQADRAFAAVTLVQKYRTYPQIADGRGVKQEPLPDAESKLVLKALAEMEWNKLDETGAAPLQTAFYQLALTPADGWTQPQQAAGQDYNAVMAEAVRKWFADHAAKYKVQRYVLETAAPKKR